MDKGFDDRALQRAICDAWSRLRSEDFYKNLSVELAEVGVVQLFRQRLAKPIINTIKDKNVIFIYYPDENYLSLLQCG